MTPSVCPFCSVGCATLPHPVDGQIVNVEGDPRSLHNEGTLSQKGAATFQLHINPNRPTAVPPRAPGATAWEVWDLNSAMDRVAQLVKKTRDETFIERLPNGKLVRTRRRRCSRWAARHSISSGTTFSRSSCAALGSYAIGEPGPDMT